MNLMNVVLLKYLSDIRFWIIITVLIKMIGITDPPIEIGHNWRQTTVAMAARNFLEVDNNILYPRIDIGGEKTGITGMEFPLFNYFIYLVSFIFGYEHWFGRLINVVISSFGAWYFFKLIGRYFTQKTAFNATVILLFSIWLSYSRKIMPDTFAVSLVIMGMYFSSNYLEKNKFWHLLLGSIFIGLGVLSKLPAGVVLTPFVIFLFAKNYTLISKSALSFFTGLAIVPSIVWYFYWVPFLNKEYGFWHFFMGKSISQGFQEFIAELPQFLEKFYGTTLFYVGFIVCLVGIYFAVKSKEKRLLWVLGISFIAILSIMFKSGQTFAHHTYYMIPFIPAMALAAGYGIANIPIKIISVALLIGIIAEGTINQSVDFKIYEKYAAIIKLESDLNHFSNKKDLIAINSGVVPTPMYFAHRKGWVLKNKDIQNKKNIEALELKGLKFIIVLKRAFGTEITLPYSKIINNENYTIYSLKK